MTETPNQIVAHALRSARLTPHQSYVIGRYMDGLKQREIADELGVSRQAIAKAIKVSIIKLRSVWPRYNQAECNQCKITNHE